MNIKELKTLLKENKINFYTYWDKKRLIALANEHDLLPKTELEKDPKYDRLKTIKQNPREVIKIYKSSPMTVRYWNNKYDVVIR